MSNTIKLVHNEEQEVEVFYNEDCVFHWNKDSDGHTIKSWMEDLLETLGYRYRLVEASEYYAEEEEEYYIEDDDDE